MSTLYHYTCSHSIRGICVDGFLRPRAQVVLGGIELVWLTDLEAPDRAGLGLTSQILRCDRTEHRIEVDAAEAMAIHWPLFARRFPLERRQLELAPGALPMHWYVSEQPLPVEMAVAA